jgi:two-component system NtrC family sensor kinase
LTELAQSCGAEELAVLRHENARLGKVVNALIARAERVASARNSGFEHLQSTVLLEEKVKTRTQDLVRALSENEEINAALRAAQADLKREIRERVAIQQTLVSEHEEQRLLIRKLEIADDQLRRAEKLAAVGQLAAGVAHEINNPMSFVTVNLETLRSYTGSIMSVLDAHVAAVHLLPADAHERLLAVWEANELEHIRQEVDPLISEALDGARRVRDIVQRLREFACAESTDWAPADLHLALEGALAGLTGGMPGDVDVAREFGELPLVDCNLAEIREVFTHLLDNAFRSILDHGVITLRTGAQDGWVWIAVADSGSGIPAAVGERIFDPFYTTRPVGSGMGLGLSASFGIIQRHGGRLEVASREGEGSTFTVHLPARRS